MNQPSSRDRNMKAGEYACVVRGVRGARACALSTEGSVGSEEYNVERCPRGCVDR